LVHLQISSCLRVSFAIAVIAMGLFFSCSTPALKAQTNTVFNPTDKFSIPAYNGLISFGANGTYAKAAFENDTWTFTDLQIQGSQNLQYLSFSAQNCNVTIASYHSSIYSLNIALLNYLAQGQGRQIINMGTGSQSVAEWSIFYQNRVLSNGNNWIVSQNGTVVVNGLAGNVTILYYGFMSGANTSNLPFYAQHSVAIASAMAVALTVVAAVAFKVKIQKNAKPVKVQPEINSELSSVKIKRDALRR